MTRMDLATAQQYIEIAGGLEEAAELFFSGGSVEQAPAIVPNQFPSCASLLWADTLHESWKEQAITFSDKIWENWNCSTKKWSLWSIGSYSSLPYRQSFKR